jgi:iron(III) transport system substrate-binding protein
MNQPFRAAIAAVFALSSSLAWSQADWIKRPAVQQLYEKAKAEKEVTFFAPNARETDWVIKAFGERFPGITIKATADLQYPTRLITEARAGRSSADVLSHSLGGLMEMQKRELLAPVDWGTYDVRGSNVVLGGQAAATHNFVYTTIYAKDKVDAKDLPKKWTDLLDPKWKGKMSTQAFLLPRMMGFLAMEWGPQQTEKWGRALIEQQNTLVLNAGSDRYLKTGERVLSVADNVATAYAYKRSGVNVDFLVMDLVPATQFIVAVTKNAPHPNAARLLAGWYASEDGKATAEKLNDESDLRPGSKSALYKRAMDAKAKILLEDEGTMAQRAEYYKQFSGFIRGTE